MEARKLILNLVPGGVLPNIKCSQYDKGIPVEAVIYDGSALYKISDSASVYVQGTKKDGTLYQYKCTHGDSTVYFELTEQMTVVSGDNIAELSIHDGAAVVGTINFLIMVEPGTLMDSSKTSMDDIPVVADLPGLVERAETAAGEAEEALENVKTIADSIDADFDRLDEAVDAAKTSADLAAFYASGTREMLTDATAEMDGKVQNAADSVNKAAEYANTAKTTLSSTQRVLDLTLAEIDIIETRVKEQAGKASTSADLAAFFAGKASTSADMASDFADDSEYWAKMSESWTQGKTGIRDGENSNNAKYWAEKAQATAKTTVDSAFSAVSLNPVENRVITSQHINKSIAQENGVHGLRYYDESLSIYNGTTGEWEDITTGGGGGINLAEPTNITLTNLDEGVLLKWKDPDDILVDGVPLAKWAGTKIVRKVGSAPTKVTDGVLIMDSKTRDQYSIDGFEDIGLTNGVTYYYGFFPYTTGMLYTYTCVKTFVPAAIYPTEINNLSAVRGYESAVLSFTSVQDASGVRLVYGTHEPIDETDGAYVDGVVSPHTVNNLTNGTQYYFKAYTYNEKRRYSASNTATVIPSPVIIKVSAENDEFIGKTVTVAGGTSQEQTFDNELELTFEFSTIGTYTVTDSYIGSVQTVNTTEYKEYEVELSLGSITVNVSQSDLYNNLDVILFKVDNNTTSITSTKTVTGASTRFSVNTGRYKIGYCNHNGSSGDGLLMNNTNTVETIADVQSVTVSELTNYDITPSFAKIEFEIGDVLQELLQSVYALEIRGSTDTSYSFTIPRVFIGNDKTENIHFYINTESGAYNNYGSYCDLFIDYKETSSSSWVDYKEKIPGQTRFIYSNIVSDTYTLTIECAKVNITYDEDFVGKYREILYGYDDAATNGTISQGSFRTRSRILSSVETVYFKPNDVPVYYNYRLNVGIYEDDTTNIPTASRERVTAASGQTVNVSLGLAIVEITAPTNWAGETVYFKNETTMLTQSAVIPTNLVNVFKVKADGTVYTISNSLNGEIQTVTASEEITYPVTMVKGAASATLSKETITLDGDHVFDTFTISDATGDITGVSSSDTDIVTATLNGSTVTVNSVDETTGNATITINIAESKGYLSGNVEIAVTASFAQIYGVEWDGNSATKWSRTDAAESFVDPSPAINNGTGSSPFDNISPWKDMVKEERSGGTMVKIPKFYYKLTKSGKNMKLQVSMNKEDGFRVSPAHMDRGDGVGERDVVYIARYPCATSTYKSTTGTKPAVNYTRAQFRTSIHNLGSTIWQNDYPMRITIWILYLVEFGDWHTQKTIGYGCGNNSGVENTGLTDAMQYHTGTNAASRTTYGHIQYRYIEDLWANVHDWCDGVYFSGADIYAILNPANFSDTANGTKVGTRPTSSGYISEFAISTASGFDWFMYPSAISGSETTYICDYCLYNASGVVLHVGGYGNQGQDCGLFCLYGDSAASYKGGYVGSRLQELPAAA